MTSNPEFDAATPLSRVCEAFSSHATGKTILVTGVSRDGRGFSAANAFAACGARLVIISWRTRVKLELAKDDLQALHPTVSVRILIIDLAVQKSVYRTAQEVNSYSENIDILINNAGVMGPASPQLTVDGIGKTFATNYLGHFYFMNLIMRKLQAAAVTQPPGSTRIVNLASEIHHLSPVRFHDNNIEGIQLPADDKQPNIQFLRHLDEENSINIVVSH